MKFNLFIGLDQLSRAYDFISLIFFWYIHCLHMHDNVANCCWKSATSKRFQFNRNQISILSIKQTIGLDSAYVAVSRFKITWDLMFLCSNNSNTDLVKIDLFFYDTCEIIFQLSIKNNPKSEKCWFSAKNHAPMLRAVQLCKNFLT